jgi:regulator of RNase E activity RraA
VTDTIPISAEILQLLSQASTATLSTQLFQRGLRNTVMNGVAPLNPSNCRFVGEAVTLRSIPAREDLDQMQAFRNPDHPQRKAIETVSEGQVLVLDCRGETRAANAGAILVTRAWKRGAVAIVSDGSFRDSPEIAEMEFPVFAAGRSPALSLAIHHAIDINVPVGCGGVAVFPGDILVGDAEGVVVIPRHLAAEIAAPAAEQERLERFIMTRVQAGAPLPGTYPPNDETLAAYQEWNEP